MDGFMAKLTTIQGLSMIFRIFEQLFLEGGLTSVPPLLRSRDILVSSLSSQ